MSASATSVAQNGSVRLPDAQLTGAGDAEVAHPLGVPARGDEVLLAVEGEEVHRRGAPLAARATAHAQLAREPHTLMPARVRRATDGLKTWLVNHPGST